MSSFVIPSGKKATIWSGANIVVQDIPIDGEITVNLSSNFGQLVDNDPNSFVSALGNLSQEVFGRGFSGAYKQAGFQVWKGTEPMAFSMNLLFRMQDSAFTVMQDVKRVIKLPLPQDTGGIGGLVPPGPSILEVFTEDSNATASEGKRLSMRIGNVIHLKRMLVRGAEPTFSQDVDDSNGLPIWVRVKLDILSIYTATTQLVEEYIGVGVNT